MAPTSSPPREDPSSEVPSIRQRQHDMQTEVWDFAYVMQRPLAGTVDLDSSEHVVTIGSSGGC
jgi:hypothetical protein